MKRKCIEKVVYEDDCVVIKVKAGTKYSVAKGMSGCAVFMEGEKIRVEKDEADTNEYMDFIKEKLDERTILEQLAEESSELAQAALKYIRAKGLSNNVTGTEQDDAFANLCEEAMDVITVLALVDIYANEDEVERYWKWERWAKRLGYKENE